MGDLTLMTTKELAEALRAIQIGTTDIKPENFKYVIYARKSTDDKDKQVRSLGDQIKECEEYAKGKNLKCKDIIQEAVSAKEPDIRPKFREMIDALKAGKYDGILSWHPDRL